MKFGEMLVHEGIITQDQLKLALERQVVFGGKIGTNLVELGIVGEDDLTRLLGKYMRIPSADAEMTRDIPEDVIQSLSKELADRYKIVPFRKERKRLHLAMADVKNVTMIDELKFVTGFDIVPYVASEIRLLYALEKYYGLKRDVRFISVLDRMDEEENAADTPEESSEELTKVKQAFTEVGDKKDIAGLLTGEARKVATRAALFLVKGDLMDGWTGQGLNVEGITLKIEPTSVFADVLAKRTYYRGPLVQLPAHQELLLLLGGPTQDSLILPIGIREKTVAVLYADNGIDEVLTANLQYLNSLAAMASLAFEILILKKKIMAL